MTESEWLACGDAGPMLEFIEGAASNRKLRLFAVACCRASRQLMLNEGHRGALDVAGRFAEGGATEAELSEAFERANALACALYGDHGAERKVRRVSPCFSTIEKRFKVRPFLPDRI